MATREIHISGIAAEVTGEVENTYSYFSVDDDISFSPSVTVYAYGISESGTVTRSYFNDILTDLSFTINGNGILKTVEQMQTQATFINWDFISVWQIRESSSFPFFGGSGTSKTSATQILIGAISRSAVNFS